MRIIKEGHIPNLEYIFTCKYCSCEFAVTQTELYVENIMYDKNSYKCPTCGRVAYGPMPQELEGSENDETSGE